MKVVLLDRDGTLVVEPPNFTVILKGLQLFPDTLKALKELAEAGFAAVIVSNQKPIAEGKLSLEEYEATNKKLLELIQPTGIKVLKIYLCPHGPEDNCNCRKPKPGMLLQAAKEFDIDLTNTYMIGDRVTDIEAGIAAGTKTILIPQGNFSESSNQATFVAANLLEAIRYIVKS